VTSIRVALGQLAPRLGDVAANLELHHRAIDEARAKEADLLVFPELGLTGYLLQDLNAEVAMRRDDERLHDLAKAAAGMSTIVGFVELSDEEQLFIAAALLEDGQVRHVYRKSYLPNYGLFEERRFFGAGRQLRAIDSRLGVRLGLCICEDFWHLPVPYLLAEDGAQILVNISSSPGRDVAAVNDGGLGTANSWRTLMRTYAQLTTCFVVFVNRVGVEESVTFWGGSQVIDPAGDVVFEAPLLDSGLFMTDIDLDDVRRERTALPLLRDERPEFVLHQLERITREHAGLVDEEQ
jgi:predicted amidohydrolase